MDKHAQALSHLLPPGYAFPRQPTSAVMSVLSGLGQSLSDADAYADEAVRQWVPLTTCSRLNGWETALGLPDACFDEQTVSQRYTAMLARLRGDLDLPYADSSGDSVGAIRAYLSRYGFDVDVWYNTPFRCGRNRVGSALGALDGILHVRVKYLCVPLAAGMAAGQRLVICTRNTEEILCLLKRVVPARFDLDVMYL